MPELGIDGLRSVLQSAISVANGLANLRRVDVDSLLKEVLDLSEEEAIQLASDIKFLDLVNDELEQKIEDIAAAGAVPVAYVLRILKVFLPKK